MSEPPLNRIRLTVHYDGSGFHGWQLQANERTVQGELERVASRLFDRPARVVGAGRTDRGVHATGQVASVDAPPGWTAGALRRAMNALLADGVWIAESRQADPDFHPRFDAVNRAYEYRVGTVDLARSPFHAGWCWPLASPLDVARMERATRLLIGDHSFRSFAKAGQEERGDRCVVRVAGWESWPPLGMVFRIEANRFLHHMVRYLVGTLVRIGLDERAEEDMARLLAGEPGFLTSPPAPAEGLFLTRIDYPQPTTSTATGDAAAP
jgi:tRNA pseudouridine38-40 synthase